MADDKFPRVGFTGTRYAVPPQQRWLIDSVLDGLYRTRGAVEPAPRGLRRGRRVRG
jgi:hypothetical protein